MDAIGCAFKAKAPHILRQTGVSVSTRFDRGCHLWVRLEMMDGMEPSQGALAYRRVDGIVGGVARRLGAVLFLADE